MREAEYQLTIDGRDVSRDLHPILISLSIKMGDSDSADEIEIELDDTDGQVVLPTMGAPVSAMVYWDDQGDGVEFEGFIDQASSGSKHHHQHGEGGHHGGLDGPGGHHGHGGHGGGGPVHSSGSRSKGRTLTLTAKSADMTGELKQRAQRHKDKSKLGDVAKAWGTKAGLTDVKVEAGLAAIERPYWSMAHESFMSWGARIADEIGATFKVYGKVAVLVPRAGGAAADGQALQAITAAWGVNLIGWSASPVKSRPSYGAFATRYYDPVAAKWKSEGPDGGAKGKGPKHHHPFKAPAKDHAKRRSTSNAKENDREKGGADSVEIDGEPAAQAGALCTVSGIRPGVDGTYLISDVTHTLSRSSGFVTRLTLKQPTGTAGSDTR